MSFFQKLKNRLHLDQNIKAYIAYNKKKWADPDRALKKSVVLIDAFDFYPAIHMFSVAGHTLAKKLNARLATFSFDRGFAAKLGIPQRRVESLYGSFGAQSELSFKNTKPYRKEARAFAEKTFSGLKTKWDVLNIQIDGHKIGWDIYDTYMRVYAVPTVDIKDEKLRYFIYEAYLIYQACKDYLSNNDVKAIFTTHWAYNSHAILARVAFQKKIPVFDMPGMADIFIREIDSVIPDPEGYTEFNQTFQSLSEDFKPKAREQARALLEQRFKGGIDGGTRYLVGGGKSGLTGYTSFSPTRKMKDTGRPRALVLLNCFFDRPHGYRDLLFPDFWEWITFLLEHASNTEIDWYVKPHPSALPGNEVVVEKLAHMFPKINFLDIRSSNKQLVEEGICAMFTTYGTAGHEFPYMGVPVVNAGDNPHITYDFNIHPKTVDEFKSYIYSADRLKVNFDRSKIEECVYMYYLYYTQKSQTVRSELWEALAKYGPGLDVDSSLVFKIYLEKENTDETRRIEKYFDDYFSKFLAARGL